MQIKIITRHVGAIAWLSSHGIVGEVLSHLTDQDIEGETRYIGVLPIPLVAKIIEAGSEFYLLDLPQMQFGARGQELTHDEMDQAGARLIHVKRIDLEVLDGFILE